MTAQAKKCEDFRALHVSGKPFIIPNPWDIGSACLLASSGAQALATTSAGFAFTVGLPDCGHVDRDEMLFHCADIVQATPLPVSADLENGYGSTLDELYETIELAIETGLAGCSIEDSVLELGDDNSALSLDFDQSVARVEAAVEVAQDCPFPFTITARADGIMLGSYDLDEAIRRIKAFEKVGAHVVYVPMPKNMADLQKICDAVNVPVNALAAGPFLKQNLSDFAKIGVARVSVGSSLARATQRLILDAATGMFEKGGFAEMEKTVSGDEVDVLLHEFLDE